MVNASGNGSWNSNSENPRNTLVGREKERDRQRVTLPYLPVGSTSTNSEWSETPFITVLAFEKSECTVIFLWVLDCNLHGNYRARERERGTEKGA